MATDKIGDMLARIKNGYLARKQEIEVPHSNYKEALAEVLVEKNYLSAIKVKEDGNKKTLVFELKYDEQGEPVLSKAERVSKPGCRVFGGANELPYVLSGYGIALVSTSKGIMTAKEARKKAIGGEIICKIW
jgi:small subunit ribosomal protein S8